MGDTGEETGSCSDEWAMLSKSLIQFSVDGQGCVPSLLFDLRPNYGGGNEDRATSFKRSHTCVAPRSAPDAAAGHRQPMPPPKTPGHSQASLVSLSWGTLLLSPGSCFAKGFVSVLQESVFPILWKYSNQIPLASKVKFPGGFQSRLGNLLWGLELP